MPGPPARIPTLLPQHHASWYLHHLPPACNSLRLTTGSPRDFPPSPVPSKQQRALQSFTHRVEVEIWEVAPLASALSMPSCPLACLTPESHNLHFWNDPWRWNELKTRAKSEKQYWKAPWRSRIPSFIEQMLIEHLQNAKQSVNPGGRSGNISLFPQLSISSLNH